MTTTLNESVYAFIPYVGKRDQDLAGRERHKSGKAVRSSKEAKFVPKLIYEIEVFEQRLLQLSKARKVNLLKHAKRSTARDFRIQPTELQRAIESHQDMSQADADLKKRKRKGGAKGKAAYDHAEADDRADDHDDDDRPQKRAAQHDDNEMLL